MNARADVAISVNADADIKIFSIRGPVFTSWSPDETSWILADDGVFGCSSGMYPERSHIIVEDGRT
jgi:hypothetical protein